jgi:hypothetical protein
MVFVTSRATQQRAENRISNHILEEQLRRAIFTCTATAGVAEGASRRIQEGLTYPVSPVACVITIRLAVEVFHHVDHRVCRDEIRSGCFLVFGGWVGGSAEVWVDQPRGAGSPDCDTAGQCRRWEISRQAEIHGQSSVNEGGGG